MSRDWILVPSTCCMALFSSR